MISAVGRFLLEVFLQFSLMSCSVKVGLCNDAWVMIERHLHQYRWEASGKQHYH